MISPSRLPTLVATFLLTACAACGPSSQAVDVASGSSGPADGADAGSSTTAPPPPPPEPPPGDPDPQRAESSSGGDDEGDPPSAFIENPDGGGVSFECDLWTQDCPAGHKCNAWANDGGGAWNATRCFPVDPDPDSAGEPCTVQESGVSGIDSCDVGALCWDVDPTTNEGTCVEYCTGDDANPICLDPEMQCGGPRDFPLCLPTCCPLEQDCPQGQACYAINHDFACAPDVSGEMGGFGDTCEFVNVCDPGLLCLGAAAITECDGAGCCTLLCEVGFEGCSDLQPGLECVPWYAADAAPPGLEHVGVCVVPR